MPDDGDQEIGGLIETWGVIVECEGEQQQMKLLQRFTEEGLTVRSLMG